MSIIIYKAIDLKRKMRFKSAISSQTIKNMTKIPLVHLFSLLLPLNTVKLSLSHDVR